MLTFANFSKTHMIHLCKSINRVSLIHIPDNFFVVSEIKKMTYNMRVMILCSIVKPIKGIKATVGRGTLPVVETKMPLAYHVGAVS